MSKKYQATLSVKLIIKKRIKTESSIEDLKKDLIYMHEHDQFDSYFAEALYQHNPDTMQFTIEDIQECNDE